MAGTNDQGFSTGKGGDEGMTEHMPDTTVMSTQGEADRVAKEAKSANQSDSGSGPSSKGAKY